MDNENLEVSEIDIRHIIELLLSKWVLISVVTVVFGAFAFIYSTYFITTLYSSDASVYVNSLKSFNMEAESVSQGVLNATQQLVPTYMELVKSKKVVSKAIKEAKLDYNVKTVTKMIETTSVEGTGIFHIIVTCGDPRHAANLANKIAEVSISEIENYVEGTSAKVIDEAEISTIPASPNIKLNTILGFLIGMILIIGLILIIDFFDVRIKSEEALEKLSKYPTLGSIPTLGVATSSGYGYRYDYRYGYGSKQQKKTEEEGKNAAN